MIDTILRSMPIPPIFIRQRVDPAKQISIREVIDGQQRLRAVLDFVKGEFPILRTHNQDFGTMYYANLPEEARLAFLRYKFVVNVFEDISDSDVLSIFSRINTYTVRLNAQELRNAQFFGLFKQTVYSLAHQHYAFWTGNKIVTDGKIARMVEAELVSELVISMIAGIRQTKAVDINAFYTTYDDEFPEREQIESRFREVVDIIADLFSGDLSTSGFRRQPLFFSLFLVIADARFGLPESARPRLRMTASEMRRIAGCLKDVDAAMRSRPVSEGFEQFVDFARSATADPGKRRYRHEFLWNRILSAIG